MNNKFTLKKIPLEEVIHILTILYEEGYDYFDIEGTPDSSENKDEEMRDIIKISIREEYFSNEEDNNSSVDYEELL
jgi:hypothetical protein